MFRNCRYVATLLLVTLSAPALGQTMFEDGAFKPFEEIRVVDGVLMRSVSDRVLYFAHFTCAFCRAAHDYLEDWGDHLPRPYRLEVVPAVALPEHYPMAIAYYVVVQLAPARLRDFERALFAELQDRGGDPLAPQTFRSAAKTVGISAKQFDAAVASQKTRGFVERAMELTRLYAIDEVPTIVVANRFKTGPGRVQNDQQSFVAILNGLVSMDYQEREQR